MVILLIKIVCYFPTSENNLFHFRFSLCLLIHPINHHHLYNQKHQSTTCDQKKTIELGNDYAFEQMIHVKIDEDTGVNVTGELH